MEIAQRHKDQLDRIKENIRKSNQYFKLNVERYHQFRKFVYDTTLTDNDKILLASVDKPQVEFNVLEAYLSRQIGEFSKQEPSITVTADNDYNDEPVDVKTVEVIEGYIRHILDEARNFGTQTKIYQETMSGGFSALKIYTEYSNPMSFKQVIKFSKAFDPTLCGFDPMASDPTKSNGAFCYECYPMRDDDFKRQFPNISVDKIKYNRDLSGFSWSYANDKENIIVLCDYYEKKVKRIKIVQLANGEVMPMDEYHEMIEEWPSTGKIEEPPVIVGKPRWTEIIKVCRYRLIETDILDYLETDYSYLPLVFVDGNSQMLRYGTDLTYFQMTRPYIYHALGAQKLKNVAGQSLANELENMIQHKFMIAKESIPDEKPYQEALTNVQKANTVVYRAFADNDPNKPVPPPREVQRVPAPPEVMATFSYADSVIQSELGSYDASLGINNNQLSGVAIVEAATQSNASGMPYIFNNLLAMNQLANIILDLIPKYCITPQTIPVLDREGNHTFVKVNQPRGVSMKYNPNALKVKVEAGVNYEIQKHRSLNTLVELSRAVPAVGEFVNRKGLKFILDNLDIHGIDQLKKLADEYMKEQEMMAQQQRQSAKNQPQNPLLMREENNRIKIIQDAKEHEQEMTMRAAEISNDKQRIDTDLIKTLAEMKSQDIHSAVMLEKADAEKGRSAVDLAIKAADMSHRHHKDVHELRHKLSQTNNERG